MADYLLANALPGLGAEKEETGDAVSGRKSFITIGCAGCHALPENPPPVPDKGLLLLIGLEDRTTHRHLVQFLLAPHLRYPDSRMPNPRLSEKEAANIASYILEHSRSTSRGRRASDRPTSEEVNQFLERLGVQTVAAAGRRLLAEKGCAACHPGLAGIKSRQVEIGSAPSERLNRGCLSDETLPRFELSGKTRRSLHEFLAIAPLEIHASGFENRRRLLNHLACTRCHQRDIEQRPPIEQLAQSIWIKSKYFVYQRTPSLTGALLKYRLDYLGSTLKNGVSGQRPKWFTYRMPSFGAHATEILKALAESDGEHLPTLRDQLVTPADPNINTFGQELIEFQGYFCVSCHVWKGETLGVVEPSSAGPELTTVTQRIRRDWFDRWLENPLRIHPRTPMPAVFRKGQPATLSLFFEGDPTRQRDALWTYLSRGKGAPDPRSKPPFALASPQSAQPSVSLIPLWTPDQKLVESICLWNDQHDLVVYDLADFTLRDVYVGARLNRKEGRHRPDRNTLAGRKSAGYFRDFLVEGTGLSSKPFPRGDNLELLVEGDTQKSSQSAFQGFDWLADGVRIRSRHRFETGTLDLAETLKVDRRQDRLSHELSFHSLPARASVRINASGVPVELADEMLNVVARHGTVTRRHDQDKLTVVITPEPGQHDASMVLEYSLPPAELPSAQRLGLNTDSTEPVGDEFFERDRWRHQRPGYRAIRYPRPRTSIGEDVVMPHALAADPLTGQLYVASVKFGGLFRLDDPNDDGQNARFVDYARGRFQEVFGMLHDGQALYLLHRRNLTRVLDTDGDGLVDRFDRIARIDHGIADVYDWAYGLVRDRQGRFVFSLAPWGNADQKGAGNVLRLGDAPDAALEEIAFGLRNPYGWCTGPDGDIFFTDNQGNWVESNKLCHLQEGRFYGYVNSEQPHHRNKPFGTTAVWVPYQWAQSINGVTYDNTGGKFGPFAGQFFLAEIMRGGAIIRASLEKVNGVYQGACFPFWGKGLMGPLTLAFDPQGRMYVGSITEPAWLAQLDRGGLYRINFTGEIPFEMQTIRVLPDGFRLTFTRKVDPSAARQIASFRIEHFRYEYSSAYGSPEVDRSLLAVEGIRVHSDNRTVDLATAPLEIGRIYSITAKGVRSEEDEPLVHDTGVYTLNELPLAGRAARE